MTRKTAASYRELEARRKRVQDLEKIYMDMAMQKELQVETYNPFVYICIENYFEKKYASFEINRKRVKNANYVKKRLYAQHPNLCSSGGQSGSVEKVC